MSRLSASGGTWWEAAIALYLLYTAYRSMHPFPPASDLQFLIGKQLERITLGPWEFTFILGNASVTVEGDLEHVDRQGVIRRHNTDEDKSSPLLIHHLIGQEVTALAVEPFCLTLTFEHDAVRIYSDNGPYECGQIYDDAGRLTVF